MIEALAPHVPIIIGAVVALVVVAVGWLVSSDITNRVPKERRRPVQPKKVAQSMLAPVAEAFSKLIEGLLAHRARRLTGMLELAGVKMRVQEFVAVVIIATFTLFFVGIALWTPLVPAALLPAAIGAAFVWLRVSARRKKFAGQLDDTLQLLASSLRSGQSLMQAVGAVALESEDPTATELGRIVNEARLGRPLADALEDVAFRMDSDDFRWASQAIAINREVGGSLADVLDGVSRTIRERNDVRRKVAALAAEGKMSAIILIALPPLVIVFLTLINPAYIAPLFNQTAGIVMLVAGGLLFTIGAFWMSRVIKVKF